MPLLLGRGPIQLQISKKKSSCTSALAIFQPKQVKTSGGDKNNNNNNNNNNNVHRCPTHKFPSRLFVADFFSILRLDRCCPNLTCYLSWIFTALFGRSKKHMREALGDKVASRFGAPTLCLYKGGLEVQIATSGTFFWTHQMLTPKKTSKMGQF